ncbi:MAG: class I SAM-dependent methyltransferase [Verrucomicrobia bacterium]|nr:class I SAM-dependent methyltransferase [Verrucomicrobiota bacterium]
MKIFETRVEMIQDLIPPGSVICEIGVFKGDFERELHKLDPHHLFLCDPWEEGLSYSGDHDGQNGNIYHSSSLYQHVVALFAQEPNVSVHREKSEIFIPKLADSCLDAAYIDGDHSNEAVKADLQALYPKIKKGGFLMGHDYELNPKKAPQDLEPMILEVARAVNEFCQEKKLSIFAKTNDGCASFAIRCE